jgi:23S rRNA maturation mini-RNase III
MIDSNERNFGPQPIADLMQQLQLKAHDLVEASTEQLTHKMVARALKGRRLTNNTKGIVQRAMNQATGNIYKLVQLFNY